MRRLTLLIIAAGASLSIAPAWAEMNKCVAADGTISFQARPCTASLNGATLAQSRDATERAVADRAEAQRRDRCRNYREIADRQRALLATDGVIDRKAVSDELAIQERRMKQDGC
jgi:hypothetical protein